MNIYYLGGNNFGDALTPLLFELITGQPAPPPHPDPPRVIGIGSIAQLALPGDTLWGTGAIIGDVMICEGVKAAAVRGPLTDALLDEPCNVYGDPAILLSQLHQPLADTRKVPKVVPHYVDKGLEFPVEMVDVHWEPMTVIKSIAGAEWVASSSLHGLVVAESYGIPAIWVEFSDYVAGGGFKFRDYYLGTGRDAPLPIDCRNGMDVNLIEKSVLQWVPPKVHPQLYSSCPFRPRKDWTRVEFGDSNVERNKIVASFIQPDEVVVEYGAGNCQLGQLIDTDYYFAYDLTDRYGAEILDLNGELPELYCDSPSVAVFSGVLEYLDDVPRVLNWVTTWADAMVLTYSLGGSRIANGWVNDYDFESLVELVPWQVEEYRLWRDQVIVRMSR